MEKEEFASDELTCAYEDREYFVGATLCKNSCTYMVCRDGAWMEEEIEGCPDVG